MDNLLNQFVCARDEAVIKCWERNSCRPLTHFIKKYKGMLDDTLPYRWKASSRPVKWLTLCKMTLNITSPEVVVFKDRALEKQKEIREKAEKYGR